MQLFDLGYKTGATISPCMKYRYSLWRLWDNTSFLNIVGLNPSTADAELDDPTIRRCIGFAKQWGYGGLYMTNLFAFRSTDPDKMKVQTDPVGTDNDKTLIDIASKAGCVVIAWGNHGKHLDRDRFVLRLFAEKKIKVQCFGLNENNTPKHPLYQPKDVVLQSFNLHTSLTVQKIK